VIAGVAAAENDHQDLELFTSPFHRLSAPFGTTTSAARRPSQDHDRDHEEGEHDGAATLKAGHGPLGEANLEGAKG